MGRKIPAKKHRGVKDPLVQQARRLASVKDKINAPPLDPDDQPVPKSLSRLFAGGAGRGRGAGRAPAGAGRGRGGGALGSLRRLAGEGARSFSRRITGAVRALHREPHLHHYPQEEEEEEEEGERDGGRRRRRRAQAPRETKQQRKKLKRQEKKQSAAEERAAEERAAPRYERVAFGDTAPAPPALCAPRRAPAREAGGAVRRGLLAARVLAGEGEGAGEGERRRLAAVAAYRALKARRGGKVQ